MLRPFLNKLASWIDKSEPELPSPDMAAGFLSDRNLKALVSDEDAGLRTERHARYHLDK
ncbi:hypothetical protein Hdeb2414_s0140g00810481 [Helianthus debilis subsp. tardiflorus]